MYTSHKQYSFGLILSANWNKINIDQVYDKLFYSVWKETTHKASKVATAKKLSSVGMLLLQLALKNVFYSSW